VGMLLSAGGGPGGQAVYKVGDLYKLMVLVVLCCFTGWFACDWLHVLCSLAIRVHAECRAKQRVECVCTKMPLRQRVCCQHASAIAGRQG
jgi:hypothetical protein